MNNLATKHDSLTQDPKNILSTKHRQWPTFVDTKNKVLVKDLPQRSYISWWTVLVMNCIFVEKTLFRNFLGLSPKLCISLSFCSECNSIPYYNIPTAKSNLIPFSFHLKIMIIIHTLPSTLPLYCYSKNLI